MRKLRENFSKKINHLSSLSLTEWQWVLCFLIAAFLLWGIGLGNLPLRDWDEGTRALVAREIYQTGNWLYPTFQGKPYLLKPPLMDWLIACSYQLGGVTEFTTRLPGAFFSACGVPLLYLVARELFLERLPAIFSAAVYLTLLPVVRHGRLAMLDGMVITFFLLLLVCLLKSRRNAYWAIGIGLCLGLITFIKGLLVVPLATIALSFIIADKQLKILKNRYFWLGLIIGNLPIIAWYTAQWQHYGSTFLQVHFQNQGLERISQAVEGHNQPAWFYLLELIKYTLPWLLFWFGGLYLAWQKRTTSWGALILIGTVGYLGVISLMKTKLPWYIMPLYPFFALAVAVQLVEFWKNAKRLPRFLTIILGLLVLVGLIGLVYFILADPQPVLMVMSVIVALTMGTSAWLAKKNNPKFIIILLIGMYLVLGLLMTSKSWIWELNEAFPVKPVAALIRERTNTNAVIYTSFGYRRPSLDFYSERQVIPSDTNTLKKIWSQQSYFLLNQQTLSALNLPDSVTLGTAEGFTLLSHKLPI
ncbi:MAG: glycosyltransferase family 39 protein [Coleofasciculaceae cyanobacterium]